MLALFEQIAHLSRFTRGTTNIFYNNVTQNMILLVTVKINLLYNKKKLYSLASFYLIMEYFLSAYTILRYLFHPTPAFCVRLEADEVVSRWPLCRCPARRGGGVGLMRLEENTRKKHETPPSITCL